MTDSRSALIGLGVVGRRYRPRRALWWRLVGAFQSDIANGAAFRFLIPLKNRGKARVNIDAVAAGVKRPPHPRQRGHLRQHLQRVVMRIGSKHQLPARRHGVRQIEQERAIDQAATAMPRLRPGIRKQNVRTLDAARWQAMIPG